MPRSWIYRLGLGIAAVALLLVGGLAYAAVKDSGTVIKACAAKPIGQLRLDRGNGCLPNEEAVQWNQVGPQGPPGNADNTVRHISNFMADNGNTVTTPVLSKSGELGKLSLSCGHNAAGGTGSLTFTQAPGTTFDARVLFISPQVPGSPTKWNSPADDTLSWADTDGDHLVVEVMIEGKTANDSPTAKPTLTVIQGVVQHFSEYSGCSFYFHVDTSNVNSGETFTPAQF